MELARARIYHSVDIFLFRNRIISSGSTASRRGYSPTSGGTRPIKEIGMIYITSLRKVVYRNNHRFSGKSVLGTGVIMISYIDLHVLSVGSNDIDAKG